MSLRTFTVEDQVWSDQDPHLPYRRRQGEKKTTVHFGQLKLLLCEMLFMTLYWDPEAIPNPIFVSVGAAEVYHFPTFIRLFEIMGHNFEYHLYDPCAFSPYLHKIPNVTLYSKYFTDEDAQMWAGRNDVIFICDIRNNTSGTPFPLPSDVELDMKMQLEWYRRMRPALCLFKFRPPFLTEGMDRFWEYLDGQVFYQTYAGQTSSETRIVPAGFNEDGTVRMRTYDLKLYEDQLFYLNSEVREKATFEDPVKPLRVYGWDEASEVMIIRAYFEKQGEGDITYEEVQAFRQQIRDEIHDHGDEIGAELEETTAVRAPRKTYGNRMVTSTRGRRTVSSAAPARRRVQLSPEHARPSAAAAAASPQQITPKKPNRK